MKLCKECRHYPSQRFEECEVGQCYCKCHDVADAAPELLAALQGVLRVADRKTVEFDAARAAISLATGEKS